MRKILALLLVCGFPAVTWASEDDASEVPTDLTRVLTDRAGDKRPDDQRVVSLFGRPLTIGGELEFRSSREDDFDLDHRVRADRFKYSTKAEVELLWQIDEDLFAYGEVKAKLDGDFERQDQSRHSFASLERGELWLYAANLWGSPWSIQIGRQNFKDKREWWWDADLEAARLHYKVENFEAELGVAQQLGRISTRQDFADQELRGVRFLLAHAIWEWQAKNRIEFFALRSSDDSGSEALGTLVRRDRRDESDARLVWLGLRAAGRIKVDAVGRFHYWADIARVSGTEDRLDFSRVASDSRLRIVDRHVEQAVRGFAVDVGATWQLHREGPAVTAGYAYGSGDAREGDDGPDSSFRQSGIHDNNGKFRGVDRFRYYGELLRPELSNLHVATLSFGLPILRSSSVELAYHHYRQDEPSRFLRAAEIGDEPGGRGRTIGQELDLVVGLEEWERWELEVVGSVFRAGSAFESLSGEYAHFVAFKIDFNF